MKKIVDPELKSGKKIHIEKQKVSDTLLTNYMPYAMSVIVSRALPEIDGFKPAHRKLLYTMYKMGLLNGPKTKSANIVGQTMRLNPHGDQAIYDTMIRLTVGNESLLLPLIDSKGNFGKHCSKDMAPAANRYTEAKLAESCHLIFDEIDKNAVEFVPNYDSTMQEPTMFPSQLPLILINGNQGIAVSMASNICSFNLSEICDATVALLKNPKANVGEYIKGPDFPTGGEYLYEPEVLASVLSSGRGNLKIRATYQWDKKQNIIIVTSIPYSTTIEAISEKIVELVKTGKIKEITNVRDETDLSGMKIAIDLKRGTNGDELMQKLYKLTPLQDTFGCNFNVLIDGKPKVLGVQEILNEWIRFRTNCVIKKMNCDISKKQLRLHLMEGLKSVALNIDKAVKIIRNSAEDKDVVPALMKGFKIDQVQAEYIAEIKLRNLNKDYIMKLTKDVDSLAKDITDLQQIVEDDKKLRAYITKEIKVLQKKYEAPRKTTVIETFTDVSTIDTSVNTEMPCRFFLTKEGYCKKILPASLKTNPEQKLKDGDVIISENECNNNEELLVYNNKQEVYKLRLEDLDVSKASDLGDYIPAKLEFSPDENMLYAGLLNENKNLLLFFENGKVAKIPQKAFTTKQNRKKLISAYSDKSPLIQVMELDNDIDLILTAANGKSFKFNTSVIPLKETKNTQGVAILKGKFLSARQAEENEECYTPRSLPSLGK